MLTVFTTRAGFVQESLVLWDVFREKLDVPKSPVVTSSSSPPSPVLLGSAARPGTAHGLGPDQGTAGVTCCPSPPPWDTPGHCPAGMQEDLLSAYHKHLQTLSGCHTNPILLQSPSFSSSSSVLKIWVYFFSVLFQRTLKATLNRNNFLKKKGWTFLNYYFHLEDTTFLCPHPPVPACLHRWGLCTCSTVCTVQGGQGHGVSFTQRHRHNNEEWERLHTQKGSKHCTENNSSPAGSLNWRGR